VLAAVAILLLNALLLVAGVLLKSVTPVGERLGHAFLPEYGAQLFLYFLAVVVSYVLRNFIEKSAQERRNDRLALEKLELETSLRKAELESLRMRLNPHFLFNTLQNVSVLADHDPQAVTLR